MALGVKGEMAKELLAKQTAVSMLHPDAHRAISVDT